MNSFDFFFSLRTLFCKSKYLFIVSTSLINSNLSYSGNIPTSHISNNKQYENLQLKSSLSNHNAQDINGKLGYKSGFKSGYSIVQTEL